MFLSTGRQWSWGKVATLLVVRCVPVSHHSTMLRRCVIGKWQKSFPCSSGEGIAVDLCVCKTHRQEKMRQHCLLKGVVMRVGKSVVCEQKVPDHGN